LGEIRFFRNRLRRGREKEQEITEGVPEIAEGAFIARELRLNLPDMLLNYLSLKKGLPFRKGLSFRKGLPFIAGFAGLLICLLPILLPASPYRISRSKTAVIADANFISGSDSISGRGAIVEWDSTGHPPKFDSIFYDRDSIVVPGAVPILISAQFSFTEGASTDRKGNVYFTDQPNNKIWKYGLDGQLSIFLDSAGRSNGMYFDRKGNLLTCADEHDQLWSISPHKKIRVLVSNFQGHRLNGPNDLWIDAHGGIYFTDPYYQRSYWDRTHPDMTRQNVFYLPKGGQAFYIEDSSMVRPNGIVGTPDGKYLYVSDIGNGKTYKYKILPHGGLGERALFVLQGSDGMTLDERGNVYLTGDGVTVYDPAGNKIAHIPVPEKWTANLCFGGRDKKELFMTASQAVYVIPMRVRGVE
jgi:gluconolactonase